MPSIDGGYYIKARKIQESEIANAPPHVREIWDWLIKEANHRNNGKFKRGQTMRSLRDIQDGLKWYVGYRKMTYSKSNCEMAMNWLRKRGMIETAKTTRGMIITILNYDTYQNPKNYESNNENATKATINEQHSDTINNNDKNVKNDKKYSNPTLIEVKDYFKLKGYTPDTASKAFDYYEANGWKDRNNKPVKNWKQKMIGVWFKPENKIPAEDNPNWK